LTLHTHRQIVRSRVRYRPDIGFASAHEDLVLPFREKKRLSGKRLSVPLFSKHTQSPVLKNYLQEF
jgi:hypothetical protein